jgi:ABC-2 type transport system permease protein
MRSLLKLTLVELKLFLREPITLVFTLILPLIILVVMGEVFGKSPGTDEVFRNVPPMDYYTPAYIGVVMSAVGIVALPVHIAGYRERGILRRLRASSLSVGSLFLSQIAVSVAITLACVAVLIIPTILVYHIHRPSSLGLVIGGSALAMLCFTTLGLFLGFILPSARAAQGLGMPLWFFMFIMSGGGPPRDVMSGIMRRVGEIMPVWHTTSLVQDAWLGFGWNALAAYVLAGVAAAAGVIVFLVFRRE